MIATLSIIALAQASTPAVPGIDEAAVQRAIENGRLVQAREMIAQAARRGQPAEVATVSRLEGELALEEGRNGDAFLAFSRAASRAPGDCRTSEGLGVAALRLGQVNAAKAALSGAVNRCPDRWRAWNALGVAHDREGNWTASRSAYERAVALKPDSALIANNRGYSLILQRRFDDAIALLSEQSRRFPDDNRIKLNLDLALVSAGKPPAPRSATETADQWSVRLNNAGYVSYLLGRQAEAQRFFSEAQLAHSTPFPIAAANAELAASQGNQP